MPSSFFSDSIPWIKTIAMVSFPWIYPVRAAQLVFAIIVLGLTAYGL